jgi:hypothetical protein
MKMYFSRHFFPENTQICPAGAELFYADGQTDRHDQANSCFWQFCEGALSTTTLNYSGCHGQEFTPRLPDKK